MIEIILIQGKTSRKDTPKGIRTLTPAVYAHNERGSEGFVTRDMGIGVLDTNGNWFAQSGYLSPRSLLGAYRGMLLAERLPHIDDDIIRYCYDAAFLERNYLGNNVAREQIARIIGSQAQNRILSRMPKDLDTILTTLSAMRPKFTDFQIGRELQDAVTAGNLRPTHGVKEYLAAFSTKLEHAEQEKTGRLVDATDAAKEISAIGDKYGRSFVSAFTKQFNPLFGVKHNWEKGRDAGGDDFVIVGKSKGRGAITGVLTGAYWEVTDESPWCYQLDLRLMRGDQTAALQQPSATLYAQIRNAKHGAQIRVSDVSGGIETTVTEPRLETLTNALLGDISRR